MRTKSHKLYLPSSRREVQQRFKEIGFKGAFSHNLVHDIANAFSYVMQGEPVQNSFVETDEPYHQNIQNFIAGIDFNKLSGKSPLEKASAAIALLSDGNGDVTEEDGEGTPIPIFSNNSAEKLNKKMEKRQEDVQQIREAGEAAQHFLKAGKCPESKVKSLSRKENKILEYLAVLNSKGSIKSQKILATTENIQMTEHGQISRLANFSSMGMPTFNYKFATKQLIVKKNKVANKQSLFLLIDDSGSMDESKKRRWLQALLLNRLQAVIDGKAELYITTFIGDIDEFDTIKASTKEEALKLIDWFPELGGGNTNVERAVKSACKCIQKGFIGNHKIKGENPQIVVINDGEDDIGDFKPSIITHGFILGQDNEGMKRMIESGKGEYKRLL